MSGQRELPAPDHLLSTEEVAAFLQVPIGTVRQWRHLGRGPVGIRVGRHVRYRRADVDAWLADQATTPEVAS